MKVYVFTMRSTITYKEDRRSESFEHPLGVFDSIAKAKESRERFIRSRMNRFPDDLFKVRNDVRDDADLEYYEIRFFGSFVDEDETAYYDNLLHLYAIPFNNLITEED